MRNQLFVTKSTVPGWHAGFFRTFLVKSSTFCQHLPVEKMVQRNNPDPVPHQEMGGVASSTERPRHQIRVTWWGEWSTGDAEVGDFSLTMSPQGGAIPRLTPPNTQTQAYQHP